MDCTAGLRSTGRSYICVYMYTPHVYIYICIHTDTHTHHHQQPLHHTCLKQALEKEGQQDTQPEQQALALGIYSMPELGFVPPSLGNLKEYPFDTQRKMFSKTIDI